MTQKNILFLVEGESTEKGFINKTMSLLPEYKPHLIITTGHEFHQIARQLIEDRFLDTAELIIEVLGKRADQLIDKVFTDIIFIYDFDAQSPKFEASILLESQTKFCDSTDPGQLFLSYPMFEAYYHVNQLPDYAFLNRKFSYKQGSSSYKNLVRQETSYHNPLVLLEKHMFGKLKQIHLQKFNHILCKDDKNRCVTPEDLGELLMIQLESFRKNQSVYVLNTFILFFWMYAEELN